MIISFHFFLYPTSSSNVLGQPLAQCHDHAANNRMWHVVHGRQQAKQKTCNAILFKKGFLWKW